MTENYINSHFWDALEEIVTSSSVVIDRPKGSAHPKFPEFIYPVDYGFLKGTTSMDGGGIDVWKGTGNNACFGELFAFWLFAGTGCFCRWNDWKGEQDLQAQRYFFEGRNP